jgi:hypothetical protein
MSYSRFALAEASISMIAYATHLGLKENREQARREQHRPFPSVNIDRVVEDAQHDRLRLHAGEIMTVEDAAGGVAAVVRPGQGDIVAKPECDLIELNGDIEQLRRRLRCEGAEVLDWCSPQLSDGDRARLVNLGAKGRACP